MLFSPKYLCLLTFILASALPAHGSAELLDGKRTTFVLADSITQTDQIYASPAAEGAAQPMESVQPEAPRSAIIETIDVAPAWSVHLIGEPVLLTRDGFQYVGFYDHEARLTLAQRKLEDRDWSFHRFPVRMGWATGSHAKLSA